jgi:Glycosyltransferase
MNGKKILVICHHFWPESFRINDICKGFVEEGYEVDVLCGIPNYPKGEFFPGYGYTKNRHQNYEGINIRRCFEIKRGKNTNLRILLNYLSYPFFSIFHIPHYLRKKYDKIYIYQLSPVLMSFTGLVLGKLKKTETIMYVLDLWPENLYSVLDIKNKFLQKIARVVSHWHYKKADKLIAISSKMKDILFDITKNPKIEFIPQSCEKIYEQEIHDEDLASRFSSGLNIVYTGNISPAQDFETVLKVAEMAAKEALDVNWIIVGDGMSFNWLKEQVEVRDLSKYFYFEGFHPMEDIPRYTGIADGLLACLAKSSLLDCTIPAKVTSYMAAGRPLLLSMDGEARDIVNTENCGFAGESGDAEQLYNNLKALCALSKEERANMGKNAKAYHLDHFERNANLRKMIDFMFD